MSIDIEIRLANSIKFVDVLNLSRAVMIEMLSVKNVPIFTVVEICQGSLLPVSDDTIGQIKKGYMFGIEGYEEGVEIGVISMEKLDSYISAEDAGRLVYISVGFMRTPLEFALAASLAIAIARLNGTAVIDDGNNWINVTELSPDEFLEELRVKGKFDDVQKAAELFFNQLPVSSKSHKEP